MQVAALRQELIDASLEFAWDQWAQIGVLASPRRRDRWAIDPEALLVFSLEVARDDPRLFDEILDWMVVNERLISVQRLRNLTRKDHERALVDAALSWVAERKPRPRLNPRTRPSDLATELTPVFTRLAPRAGGLDEAFRDHGYAKAATDASQKSTPPDMQAPVSFAFRLRLLFGVSARAEVLRCLFTTDAPRVSAQVLARGAAYSKRNVQEALNSLKAAQVVSSTVVGGDQAYWVEREVWSPVFRVGPEGWPQQKDWPQLFGALARMLRWLTERESQDLSDYMLASQARDLIDDVADDLLYAGVPVERIPAGGWQKAWPSLVATARNAVAALR